VPEGEVWRFYYYAGAARIAFRAKDSTNNEQVYYLFADHLGSTNVTSDPAGNQVSLSLYKAWGESRLSAGSSLTDYGYTGQRNDNGIGLYFYNARWYDSELGRFTQPDSIVPDPGKPISYDRYAYAQNNPILFNDPSGHDVGCAGLEADECSSYGILSKNTIIIRKANAIQDNLMRTILKGSGKNSAWIASDTEFYYDNRAKIWDNPQSWKNPDPEGLSGWAARVERLESSINNTDEFVEDFGLVWGGIPTNQPWVAASLSVSHGPHELSFFNENLDGMAPEYIDTNIPDDNQSHHYAGIFYLAYPTGPIVGKIINLGRDTNNPGDQLLGQQAASDVATILRGNGDVKFSDLIRALSVTTK
jgi:RHS repeat-associated protein